MDRPRLPSFKHVRQWHCLSKAGAQCYRRSSAGEGTLGHVGANRVAWLSVVASEKDLLVDKGYTFEVNDAFEVSDMQFDFDWSLYQRPSSAFINVIP